MCFNVHKLQFLHNQRLTLMLCLAAETENPAFHFPPPVSSRGHNSTLFLQIYDKSSSPLHIIVITTRLWHCAACSTLNYCRDGLRNEKEKKILILTRNVEIHA